MWAIAGESAHSPIKPRSTCRAAALCQIIAAVRDASGGSNQFRQNGVAATAAEMDKVKLLQSALEVL